MVNQMQAFTLSTSGGPEVLTIGEVADPEPAAGQVLIDIAATAVNRADVMQRNGFYPPPPGFSDIPGLECSGKIAALGEGVTGWSTGDEVCALLTAGGYAEKVVVPAGQLLPVPRGISLVEAAALPEAACTVWSNVFQRAALGAGETLLVHGGSSGIGTLAIQLAVHAGARVFATVGSPDKAQRVRDLGARAILYRDEDFVDVLSSAGGADVILDNMGALYLTRNVKALADGGRLVIIGMQGGVAAELDIAALLGKRGAVHATSLRSRSARQKADIVAATRDGVWPAVEAAQVRPIIDRVLPLTEAAAAHRLLESSTHVGKIVLQVT